MLISSKVCIDCGVQLGSQSKRGGRCRKCNCKYRVKKSFPDTYWTQDEVVILQASYAQTQSAVLVTLLPRHSARSIAVKAHKLGIKKHSYFKRTRMMCVSACIL